MLLIKKIQNLKLAKVNFMMNINSQKETWSNFKKLTLYISLAIILILTLMALFLL
jgi:hypothetical protein